MPTNMSLVVNIALSGSQNQRGGWTLTPTYSQGTTTPASSNVVESDGTITLGNMAKTDDYNNATQVSFAITSTNVTDRSGNPATVYFASPRTAAITFTPANGTEFSDFEDEGSGDILTFLDADDDHGSYSYCLTVTCFEGANPSGTNVNLDPRIVNRP